ncbi:D-alanine--D-alanine ligase [Brochothrix campestris]|uniref:D-alanine--D-alanine ligase n=1 Tax=Brochothrix campestris FSL F6-1037 TaxID=1265861 RepID=W7CUP3_9LIST|nr:D-alanine--D-alanine ligase [Brochothrix campestris]EUJ40370.1 D-alanyl-alanine synthetase A [Brochothrix campestris FSL F6-1037]
MKQTVVVFYGGKSAEHEVSVVSAFSVIKALDYNQYHIQPMYISYEGVWIKGPLLLEPVANAEQLKFTISDTDEMLLGDGVKTASVGVKTTIGELTKIANVIAFPVLHGPNGEDGTIQGLFETLNIPYVGANVIASAAGMDKIISKEIFTAVKIPQVPYVAVRNVDWEDRRADMVAAIAALTYPVFVKPANMGSSVGISKVTAEAELEAAMAEAFLYDRRIVVEQGVTAREVEVAVLGNERPEVSVAGEITPEGESHSFYTYKAKYADSSTQLVIPAPLDEGVYEQIVAYAKKAYIALDGTGVSRADFFVTADNSIYLNELNTMPGFTPVSMFPLLWAESGLPYDQLLNRMIELAQARFAQTAQLQNKSE